MRQQKGRVGNGWDCTGQRGWLLQALKKLLGKSHFKRKVLNLKKKKQTKNLKPFNPERNTSMHVFVIAEESEIQRTVENVVVKSPNMSFPVALHWEM